MEEEQGQIKQVIVIRKDLKMRRGKEIAQGAHAAMAWLTELIRPGVLGWPETASVRLSAAQQAWVKGSFRKVVCQVDTEEELLKVHEAARAAGLESHLITDSGFTEFHGEPTNTAVGIGPDYAERIDPVTGGLALY